MPYPHAGHAAHMLWDYLLRSIWDDIWREMSPTVNAKREDLISWAANELTHLTHDANEHSFLNHTYPPVKARSLSRPNLQAFSWLKDRAIFLSRPDHYARAIEILQRAGIEVYQSDFVPYPQIVMATARVAGLPTILLNQATDRNFACELLQKAGVDAFVSPEQIPTR